jgi:hypothetical protein
MVSSADDMALIQNARSLRCNSPASLARKCTEHPLCGFFLCYWILQSCGLSSWEIGANWYKYTLGFDRESSFIRALLKIGSLPSCLINGLEWYSQGLNILLSNSKNACPHGFSILWGVATYLRGNILASLGSLNAWKFHQCDWPLNVYGFYL